MAMYAHTAAGQSAGTPSRNAASVSSRMASTSLRPWALKAAAARTAAHRRAGQRAGGVGVVGAGGREAGGGGAGGAPRRWRQLDARGQVLGPRADAQSPIVHRLERERGDDAQRAPHVVVLTEHQAAD